MKTAGGYVFVSSEYSILEVVGFNLRLWLFSLL